MRNETPYGRRPSMNGCARRMRNVLISGRWLLSNQKRPSPCTSARKRICHCLSCDAIAKPPGPAATDAGSPGPPLVVGVARCSRNPGGGDSAGAPLGTTMGADSDAAGAPLTPGPVGADGAATGDWITGEGVVAELSA